MVSRGDEAVLRPIANSSNDNSNHDCSESKPSAFGLRDVLDPGDGDGGEGGGGGQGGCDPSLDSGCSPGLNGLPGPVRAAYLTSKAHSRSTAFPLGSRTTVVR